MYVATGCTRRGPHPKKESSFARWSLTGDDPIATGETTELCLGEFDGMRCHDQRTVAYRGKFR